jgi:hypothetical protein
LKFHHFCGEGKITVRYQHGQIVNNVFNCNDTRLQIDPVSSDAWEHPVRSVRRKLCRTRVRLRVTSENRKPVWVELPLFMHRPMPATSDIRAASIIRQKVGRSWRHKLVVTVTVPETLSHIKRDKMGAAGIDIGWRKLTGGLRVAYWRDDTGNASRILHPAIKDFIRLDDDGMGGQLILPERICGKKGFGQTDNIKSVRDDNFNKVKNVLQEWLKDNLDTWLTEETKTLSQWRGHGRLITLIRKWQENRVPNDEKMLDTLEEWRGRENHLYDYESNLRDRLEHFRREIYRVFASQISITYGKVILEDFDLSRVSRKPMPENGTQMTIEPDHQRAVAAVSTLRLAIESSCRRERTEVLRLDPANSTMECNECGHVEKFNAAANLIRLCPSCGAIWDQDSNAADVMLQRSSTSKIA